MLPDPCGLLLKFQLPLIAVVGDIKKGFPSIGLQTVVPMVKGSHQYKS